MENKTNTIDIILKWIERNVPLILLVSILLSILIPAMVFLFSKGFHEEYGVIGDLIGGTTAPIFGVLSALLIFISFKAQIQANEKLSFQFIEEKKDKIFLLLMGEFNALKVEVESIIFSNNKGIDGLNESIAGDEKLINSIDINKAIELSLILELRSNLNKYYNLFDKIKMIIAESSTLQINDYQQRILHNRYWLYYRDHLTNPMTNLVNLDISNLVKASSNNSENDGVFKMYFGAYKTKITLLNKLLNGMFPIFESFEDKEFTRPTIEERFPETFKDKPLDSV